MEQWTGKELLSVMQVWLIGNMTSNILLNYWKYNYKFELDMVELVLPLSAISEKAPNSTAFVKCQ